MTIQLNGSAHTMPSASTVATLLSELNLEKKPVIVEHNHTALLPRLYSSTTLKDGDIVELITIAAGG